MNVARHSYSLDGIWSFVPDRENVGQREEWFANSAKVPAGLEIQVPGIWNQLVPDFYGAGWYFHEFDLDSKWDGLDVVLRIEAVNYYCEVWLNSECIGTHEGGYTPFSLNASKGLQTGTNRIAVRVVSPFNSDGANSFNHEEIPTDTHLRDQSFAGIWGSVTLESRPETHITDIFILPDIRQKEIKVEVETSVESTVRLQIEGSEYTVTGTSGLLTVKFPDHELWSPDNPYLYTLRCELVEDDSVIDTMSVRFGMREFTVREDRFYLNNRPIFIKAVIFDPDYPRSSVIPESAEIVHDDLELAKQAGFNMVYLQKRCATKQILDFADEIGMMVCEGPTIGQIKKSPHMSERCEREVRELVMRDRNHPSVVIWNILSHTGNAGYVTNGGAQTLKDDLCTLARSLDKTRVIIDDIGGSAYTREPARYMRPYHNEFEVLDDLMIYQRAPVDREMELYYTHSGEPDGLGFLHAGYGGVANPIEIIDLYNNENSEAEDADQQRTLIEILKKGFSKRSLDRVFGSIKGFSNATLKVQAYAAKCQIDAIRSNHKIAGYCYGKLCDTRSDFTGGILDIWRRKKPVFDVLRQAQSLLRPLIHIGKTNLSPREEVQVSVIIVNDERIEGQADLSLQVVGPTNQVLWKKKRGIKIPKSGKEIWHGKVSASGSTGTHKFVVRLMQHMKVIAQNSIELHVLKTTGQCGEKIHVLDPHNEWQAKFARLAKKGTITSPLHIIPPLANTIRAYPDNELAQILAQVEGGAVALWFSPPDDWNDLIKPIDPQLCATSRDAVCAPSGAYHYAKLHPVFDNLPARRIMRQQYRNIVSAKTFIETSDEDISGTFDTTPLQKENSVADYSGCWGSDILVKRCGSGRIVFTHMRILENLGQDIVADHLFVNMLKHFTRRSVPSNKLEPLHQRSVEWLRAERLQHVRHWKVLGMFPNWNNESHDKIYPPEETIDFDATYPGWYKAITWKRWYSTADSNHIVDFQEALSPVYQDYPRFDYGTAYAYAEFACSKRLAVTVKLGLSNATKVWVNHSLIHENNTQFPHDEPATETTKVSLKQGRNIILVKVSKTPGPFRFSIDFESTTEEPLTLKWWK